ncbi:type II toxin-antitoxin system antitoxin SocA domain-containing protein [Lysobacter firmicutimachus]|uniref:Type II toxin-antitoxin system antitoxin SocA domain-containing protein n=1 Tax=Lysobacter firmicutimachus TaxID=1792846 RepID=A0AAU8MYZ0_9GAMM
MSYEAETIANAFLRLAKEDCVGISNMKMQKLLYFAQGHAMSLLDEELISDNCQAWDYGPVFPHTYHCLKKYGAGDITAEIESDEDPDRFEPRLDPEARALVRAVWKKYGKLGAIHLSELSHVKNGPWAITRSENNGDYRAVIKKSLIEQYFKGLPGASQ